MRFIELKEYYYSKGAYRTKPVLCNAAEISSITEACDPGFTGTYVMMNNGKCFRVKDTYQDIVKMIESESKGGIR